MPAPAVEYRLLSKTTHPEHDAHRWAVLRVLYAGGLPSRWPKKVVEDVFPMRAGEESDVYEERKKRAFFVPYPGQLVDFIVASIASDPVHLCLAGEPGESSSPTEKDPDPFFVEWFKDVSKKGGKKQSFNEFLREMLTTALVTKRAWALVDLPHLAEGEPPPSDLADEEKRGLRDPYVVALAPECVRDWEEDPDTGEILWALVCVVSNRREDLSASRDRVREEFVFWTREDWTRFVVTYERETEKGRPTDRQIIEPVASGAHSFGKVPLVPFELPDGLFAMGKIESLAREHFNSACALAWGVYRSLFQFLLVKLGEDDGKNPVAGNPNRATDQAVGPGRAYILAAKDDASFIGADASPFAVAQDRLDNLRDEMHRVLHNMALSTDNSAGALKRSADSKKQDSAATAVVLKALGRLLREYAIDVVEMAQHGRKEEVSEWIAKGADEFDEISLDAFVEEATLLENVEIPSATFQRKYKSLLARRILGSAATDEEIVEIEKELEDAITPESLMPPLEVVDPLSGAPVPAGGAPAPAKKPKKPPSKNAAKKPQARRKR